MTFSQTTAPEDAPGAGGPDAPAELPAGARALWRAMVVGGAGSAVAAAAAALRYKLVSVSLGPEGLGLIGQLYGLALVIVLLSTFVSGGGLARYLSEAFARHDRARVALIVRTAVLALVVPALGLTLLAYPLATELAHWVLADPELAGWVRWVVPCLPLAAVSSLCLNVLRADRQVKPLARAEAVIGCVGVALTAGLICWRGLEGVVLFPLGFECIRFACLGTLAWPRLRDSLAVRTRWWEGQLARSLSEYGAAAVCMSVVTQVLALAVGRWFLAGGRAEEAGVYRSLWLLSEGALALTAAGYHGYLYPSFCRTEGSRDGSRALDAMLTSLPALWAPLFVGMSLLAPWMVRLLYSSSFESAASLVRLTLIGDFLRAATVVVAIPLLARGRLGWLVGLSFLRAALIWTLFVWWEPRFGIGAYAGGYVAASAVALVAQAAAVRAWLGISATRRSWAVVGGVTLVLAALAVALDG